MFVVRVALSSSLPADAPQPGSRWLNSELIGERRGVPKCRWACMLHLRPALHCSEMHHSFAMDRNLIYLFSMMCYVEVL